MGVYGRGTTPDGGLARDQGELDRPVRSAAIFGRAGRRVARRAGQTGGVEPPSVESGYWRPGALDRRRPTGGVVLGHPSLVAYHALLTPVTLHARCTLDDMDGAAIGYRPCCG